ncbi:hypothetical protein PO902_09170 [Planococcus maritimus]|nr:hypothetical protein [Planococcus sp. SK3692]MDE4085191.1 hypothetical protein [Planococcus maritimus]
MLGSIYILFVILFTLSMGAVIGLQFKYKEDERYNKIVSNAYMYSWIIVLLGGMIAFALHAASFIHVQPDIPMYIVIFSIFGSGIFNGLYVFLKHQFQ